MNIAIEGCCHGDLDRIYEVLQECEMQKSVKADFIICCGDFQAIRTEEELSTLACPPVYRHMKDFHKYEFCITFSNHEAPGHLRDMYFGGFASENIFYMGNAGVYNIGGLRVVGLSGIFKERDFDRPIFESPPYTEDTKRSAYHVRRFDIERLALLRGPVDIVVSHDWPRGITNHGDTESMLRKKDKTGQLRNELNSGEFGNPHQMELLKLLKPKFWFSGHMHVKYPALYVHADGDVTRFLALDKCIPYRPFLQLIGVDKNTKELTELRKDSSPMETNPPITHIAFDLEWMAILMINNCFIPVRTSKRSGPLRPATPEAIQRVKDLLRSATVTPKPLEVEQGLFAFPYLGQIHPGENAYRKYVCEILGISDRISENDQFVWNPQVSSSKQAEPVAEGGSDVGPLFFLDD